MLYYISCFALYDRVSAGNGSDRLAIAPLSPVFIAALPLLLVFVYVVCGYYYGTAVSILGFGAAELLGVTASLYLAAAFLPLALTASLHDYQPQAL